LAFVLVVLFTGLSPCAPRDLLAKPKLYPAFDI
jgi:hypothetical protein